MFSNTLTTFNIHLNYCTVTTPTISPTDPRIYTVSSSANLTSTGHQHPPDGTDDASLAAYPLPLACPPRLQRPRQKSHDWYQ